MAKRKRLTPAQADYLQAVPAGLETKAASVPVPPARAPIAQVAGEASAASALQDLAGEVRRARDEGRMILTLPLGQVEAGYLVRDRMVADEDELFVLAASIEARGQQTPIEVVRIAEDRYGLISGWRRLTALQRLHDGSDDGRFATVQALLRQPETAADAYVAMVEENEIRVGLSYYERARIAAKAVEQGVYDTEKQALQALYTTASRAKRSKIRAFLALYRAADDLLTFPAAIGERLGLALAKALETQPDRAGALRGVLERTPRDTAGKEIACLEAVLKGFRETASLNTGLETKSEPIPEVAEAQRNRVERPARGIDMASNGRTVTLTGPGVTEAFRARLLDWLKIQG
ncbi:MAG: ParB N-terminal domain-containing protein [Rhodobacter sp.]|nr:ParB N-terminal domain-containing protein [Rhodobacter sp.]